MTTSLSPVVYYAPLVNPAPTGLFAAVQWNDEAEPLRWLGPGVDVRVINYGGEHAYGVWEADPFALDKDLTADDVKIADFPTAEPDTFRHFTSWAADDCDLTVESQDLVIARAQQVLRLQEQTAVEQVFADRLLDDAGTPVDADDLVDALSVLEGFLAETGTAGVIHANAQLAAVAANAQLIRWSGTKMLTPLGHQWVFGGGYIHGLGETLVASSPVFGWRGPVAVRTAIKMEHNRFYAIAERSLALGYEVVLGAASIAGGSV